MSYDLILAEDTQRPLAPTAVEGLRQRVSASPILSGCEVLDYTDEENGVAEKRGLLVVCLSADDDVVERSFAELKKVAQEYGLQLHDPQIGSEVDLADGTRFPGMY